jgi:hypothetical protein
MINAVQNQPTTERIPTIRYNFSGSCKSEEMVFARSLKKAKEFAKNSAEYRFKKLLKGSDLHDGFTDCKLHIYQSEVRYRNQHEGWFVVDLFGTIQVHINERYLDQEEQLENIISRLPPYGYAGFMIRWDHSFEGTDVYDYLPTKHFR